MREDNANFVVDVLFELLRREGRDVLLRGAVRVQVAVGILARTVSLLKQLSVDLARPISVGDGGGVRGQLSVDCVSFLAICQALLHN